ncbi:MAG: hypothetical protein E6I70_12965 [Chloroflexi bacterium]|nr:MAG: hypothetical protein E6I63_11965 [Chloroflexota bacterium]TME16018.1 MAG: hypothetical protein E6I70_12965 [Chloroflexota bacterium]
MVTVSVKPDAAGWLCTVEVRDNRSATLHLVRVSADELRRLGGTDPADLVRRSFEFLLAKEAKESILREFDISAIKRYFPDYEAAIRS